MFPYSLADNYGKNYGVVKPVWRRYVLDTVKCCWNFLTFSKDLRVIQKTFSQFTSVVAGFMQNQNLFKVSGLIWRI